MELVVKTTPRLLYLRERSPSDYSGRKLGGLQARSERVRRREYLLPALGFESPNRPARSESLYRLSYPGRNLLSELSISLF
jgi:hypothetical protein